MKNIVNVEKIDWQASDHGDFSFQRKQLGPLVGNQKLGTSLYQLMPGKKAYPFHHHFSNEEAVFVLEGSGTLRIKNERIAINKGDYIALPPGPEYTHQIINTSDQPLLYLCFSTNALPEVIEYPDSNKIAYMVMSDKKIQKGVFREQEQVEYFDGES